MGCACIRLRSTAPHPPQQEEGAPTNAKNTSDVVGTTAAAAAEIEGDDVFSVGCTAAYMDLPHFDQARLRELENVVDLRETLHDFVKHSHALLQKLDSLIRRKASSVDIAKAAHALKGAAKTVGAVKLSASAEHIEKEAKEGKDCNKYRQMLESSFEGMACNVSRL